MITDSYIVPINIPLVRAFYNQYKFVCMIMRLALIKAHGAVGAFNARGSVDNEVHILVFIQQKCQLVKEAGRLSRQLSGEGAKGHSMQTAIERKWLSLIEMVIHAKGFPPPSFFRLSEFLVV